MTGIETSLGLMLTHMVGEGVIGLNRLVELMAVNPRAILRNAADIRMADYHYARVRFLDMRPGDALELLLHDYDPATDETTLAGRFSVELAALADSWPMTESSQGAGTEPPDVVYFPVFLPST